MGASDILAAVALAVSIFAATISYRLGQRTLTVTTYQGATDLTLQMDRMLIEFPALRPYFYEGKAVPAAGCGDPDLRNRVLAAAEFVVDVVECIWDHSDTYEADDREAWAEWIHGVFAGSPACRELYTENPGWYPALKKLADEGWSGTPGIPGTRPRQ